MRRTLVVLAAAGVAACAPLAPAPEEIPARPGRESISRFLLEGRVAVRTPEQSFSARVDWRHDGPRDEILVSTPLGQGVARLSGDARGAVLETADQGRYEAGDLSTLSARVFGAALPLEGMPSWVVGATHGAAASVERDPLGRPATIVEDGWRIEYPGWESPSPDALPSALRLAREGMELRLRVDRWNLE